MSNDLKKQIEYYLSDSNLKQDEFFHEQISKNDGYLPIHLILKCNKIKKLGATEESQLVEAIKDSQFLELNEAHTSVRRRGNPQLPVLNPVKKIKTNENQAAQVQGEKVENPFDHFEPIVFTLKAPEGIQVTWGQVSEALQRQYNLSAPYVRYGKTEGNFAMNKKRTAQETIDKLTVEGIKIGDNIVTVTVTSGDTLSEFWAHHGKHYQGIIKRAKDSFNGKPPKEQLKFQKNSNRRSKDLVFHNQKYKDINQLKNIFKTILARSENGAPLKEPYHSMLLELLQYHDKKDKKISELKHFTVGTHPEHPETRCFMVVKQDGSQEDFSCIKCIQNLQTQLESEQ